METIGQRIKRLRAPTGWSRAELGRRMAKAIGRTKPFSGEVIRLYETGINAPGDDARSALAKVFDRSEPYIEFGVGAAPATTVRQPVATYGLSDAALEIARTFDQLSPTSQQNIRSLVNSLRAIEISTGGSKAVQHDVRIKRGRISEQQRRKKSRTV